MPYDAAQDPYLDPKTKVLKNKIGARTQAALDKAEAEITYVIIATLTSGSKPESLQFDTRLLLEVHREIFRDIYSWAGKIRTYDISKETSYFAHAAHIESELGKLDEEFRHEDESKFVDRSHFVNRITHYYSEINAIHPFREGNGRVLRTFLRLYALKFGYDIEWVKMDSEENIEACKYALGADDSKLAEMLDKLIVRINNE